MRMLAESQRLVARSSALFWHLLLKLWFKAIIGVIVAIFRLELYIMVLGYKRNLSPDLTKPNGKGL